MDKIVSKTEDKKEVTETKSSLFKPSTDVFHALWDVAREDEKIDNFTFIKARRVIGETLGRDISLITQKEVLDILMDSLNEFYTGVSFEYGELEELFKTLTTEHVVHVVGVSKWDYTKATQLICIALLERMKYLSSRVA